MVNEQTIKYLHSTMYELKERIKTADASVIYAIGSVLEDVSDLIHILEGNKSVFRQDSKGEDK